MTNKYSDYSAVCAIAKDEDSGILHWVNYNFAIGFEKIYIFDNNSKNPLKKILKKYIENGIVHVFEITEKESPQLSAYTFFLQNFAQESRWVAFIDIDEYICPLSCNNINNFLSQYEEYAALGIHWKIFTSNGHISRPKKSPVDAYTTVWKEATLIKSIIQTRFTKEVVSPHHFTYTPGMFCVNEHGIPILGPRSYHTSQTIQINHYYFKSQQDFENKKKRGLATPVKGKPNYDMAEFYLQADRGGEQDTRASKYNNTVALFARRGPAIIASIINDGKPGDTDKILADISPMIINGEVDKARAHMERALRYRDDPVLHLALARLHASEKNFEPTMQCVRNALKDLSDVHPLRKQAYQELIKIYEIFGLTRQSKALASEFSTAEHRRQKQEKPDD